MLCVACGARRAPWGECCPWCLGGLVPGGERHLPGGLLVAAAYRHAGTARVLVHRLKYGGIAAAARPLAAAMVPAVAGATALIPAPRVAARRWRHGVDPALELAVALARVTGIPLVEGLAPGWWHPARAGPAGRRRGVPQFRLVGDVPDAWVLVDDVLTTGTTLRAAAQVLPGAGRAVVATVAQAAGG